MKFTYNRNTSKYAADYDTLSVEDRQYWTEHKYFAMREFVDKYCNEPLSNLILTAHLDKRMLTSEIFDPIIRALSESIHIDHNNKNDVAMKSIFESILLDVYKVDERLGKINDLIEDIINDKVKE